MQSLLRMHLLQQGTILLCAEGRGELIPAAKVTCQKALLMGGLGLLILQSICIFGSLCTAQAILIVRILYASVR